MWELGLELVPGDRKDLARWRRLGGTWVALPKAASPVSGSVWLYQRTHDGG